MYLNAHCHVICIHVDLDSWGGVPGKHHHSSCSKMSRAGAELVNLINQELTNKISVSYNKMTRSMLSLSSVSLGVGIEEKNVMSPSRWVTESHIIISYIVFRCHNLGVRTVSFVLLVSTMTTDWSELVNYFTKNYFLITRNCCLRRESLVLAYRQSEARSSA